MTILCALGHSIMTVSYTHLDDGKVLNIYCWNEEFKSRITAHYPDYKEVDATHGKIGDEMCIRDRWGYLERKLQHIQIGKSGGPDQREYRYGCNLFLWKQKDYDICAG